MQIAGYNIKPILLYLPDDEFWRTEHTEATEYLWKQGITDIEHIAGVHSHKWGITGRHIYLLDGRPEEQFLIGDNKVGGFISHYILYCCMNVMPDTHFMVMEGDMRFVEGGMRNAQCAINSHLTPASGHPSPTERGTAMTPQVGYSWRERLTAALEDVPEDFDFLFVGSCCAMDKEPVHVKGEVYEFPWRGEEKWNYYPQCGHCYIVAKKCMPWLIATQRDTANPVDVALIKYAFPKLKVYAILPRIADQGIKTHLPV